MLHVIYVYIWGAGGAHVSKHLFTLHNDCYNVTLHNTGESASTVHLHIVILR